MNFEYKSKKNKSGVDGVEKTIFKVVIHVWHISTNAFHYNTDTEKKNVEISGKLSSLLIRIYFTYLPWRSIYIYAIEIHHGIF